MKNLGVDTDKSKFLSPSVISGGCTELCKWKPPSATLHTSTTGSASTAMPARQPGHSYLLFINPLSLRREQILPLLLYSRELKVIIINYKEKLPKKTSRLQKMMINYIIKTEFPVSQVSKARN